MNADKIRNLTNDELRHQERDLADQLFKLKFQLNMGQTESLNKIRSLRRGVARLKTIARERALGIAPAPHAAAPKAAKAEAKTEHKPVAHAKHAAAKTGKSKAKPAKSKAAAKKSGKR